ncbi:MAG: HEAT repeat domain-containing protein [Holophagales bacterium]|nr:HEAT repeat domain-containing protein [Holophagales bacterium]
MQLRDPKNRNLWRLVVLVVAVVMGPLIFPASAAAEKAARAGADAVLEGLQSPEPAERADAARQLSGVAIELWTRDFDTVAPAILAALGDTDPDVRRSAAVSLFQATWVIWGSVEVPTEKEAVLAEASPKLRALHPQLLAHLGDSDPGVREYLLRALGTWMPQIPSGLSLEVLERVDDPSAKVANLALRVIGRAGERTAEVEAKVLEALEEKAELRATAAAVLGELYAEPTKSTGRAPASAEIVEALARAAGDVEEPVRLAALRALGKIGAGSEAARARLQAAADDTRESERVRQVAEESLHLLDAYEATASGAGSAPPEGEGS